MGIQPWREAYGRFGSLSKQELVWPEAGVLTRFRSPSRRFAACGVLFDRTRRVVRAPRLHVDH